MCAQVYAEKIVQDEVDDREGRPRLPMRTFLHLHYLDQKGCAAEAARSVELAVVNILAHLRGHASSTADDDDETGGGGGGGPAARLVFTGRSARVALFARFLGLRHEGLEPIPLEGLGVYLAALARAQRGAVPLLPLSGERISTPTEHFAQALDWVFGQV